MIRLLLLLLGALTAHGPGRRATVAYWPAGPGTAEPGTAPADPALAMAYRSGQGTALPPPGHGPAGDTLPQVPVTAGGGGMPGPRRRRVPRWLKWTVAVAVIALIFRRAIASVVLLALSAALHLVGINVHLPHIRFGWPWQSVTAGTTTNTDLGPWVLQKIEGISRPALGQANFNFIFTHKVSKSIGPWPCWYASTFNAVGHASATVNLNPGPRWWAPGTGHYRLHILSGPHGGTPGHVTVAMVLPQPQLPRSVHDVTIDNVPSKPIDTQHSWTYPGLGCGLVLRPQFPQSVLYAQAQQIAFYKSRNSPQITRALVGTAEAQAVRTIRDNFVQPTVNAFGYTLDRLTITWARAR